MTKIKTKINKLLELKQNKDSTSLVGVIWVFMVLISSIWNSQAYWDQYSYKSSILESNKVINKIDSNISLTIWKQKVIIWWQEYTIEITQNF